MRVLHFVAVIAGLLDNFQSALRLSWFGIWIWFAFDHSDLSVWCFACDSYLDARVIMQLKPVSETAYILKFGEAPPFRSVECSKGNQADGGASSDS